MEMAKHLVIWRNPKIHLGDRVKTWGACDEHREFLIDYLSARDFYLKDEPFEASNT